MTEVQFAKQFLTTLDSKPTKYQADHAFDPQTFQVRTPYTLPKLSHPPHPLPSKSSSAAAATTPAPGSQPAAPPSTTTTINITLKSSRNPSFTLHLPSTPSNTPITTLKTQIQTLLSSSSSSQIPAEKIKILYNKKPIGPTKSTVHDVITTEPATKEVEFGVMVLGGAPDPSPTIQTLNLNNDLFEASTQETDLPGSENAAVQAADIIDVSVSSSESAEGASATSTETKAKTLESGGGGGISGRAVLQTDEFWSDLQGFLEQRLRSSEVAVEVRGVFEKAVRR